MHGHLLLPAALSMFIKKMRHAVRVGRLPSIHTTKVLGVLKTEMSCNMRVRCLSPTRYETTALGLLENIIKRYAKYVRQTLGLPRS